MRTLLWSWLFLIATSLSACVQVKSGTSPLVVSVKGEGDGCRVTANGQRVTSDELLGLGRRDSSRRAIVLYDKKTPYKCTGAAIVTLQRAGLEFVEAAM